MQITPEDQMVDVIGCAVSRLDPLEAAFVEQYYLQEPKITLPVFAAQWRLSAKALSDLRIRVLRRMKGLLAEQGIISIRDIL